MADQVVDKIISSRSKQKLDALLEITQAINSNFSASDLFRIFEFVLAEQLGINKFAYCANETPWRWTLVHDAAEEIAGIHPENDLNGIRDLVFTETALTEGLRAFQVVIPVFHKTKALAYVLVGGMEKDALEELKEHDLEFIQTISNIVAVAIENKRLFKESVQQELLKRELELAKEMQSHLFPASLPDNEHLQISAYYQPHRHVGGDYYDFIRLSPKEVLFCVADVSGKGVSAALLMSNFQANLRALASSGKDLQVLVRELNAKVMQNAKGEKFITLFLARYNCESRNLLYINAGHNPPLLRSKKETQTLSMGCPGLGILDELPRIETGSLFIEPDSFLLCYTDGLVEQENEGGKDFGMEHLTETLTAGAGLSTAEFNEMLVQKLATYKGDKPYIDDIALLSCKFF